MIMSPKTISDIVARNLSLMAKETGISIHKIKMKLIGRDTMDASEKKKYVEVAEKYFKKEMDLITK
jgi:hypothetical protein